MYHTHVYVYAYVFIYIYIYIYICARIVHVLYTYIGSEFRVCAAPMSLGASSAGTGSEGGTGKILRGGRETSRANAYIYIYIYPYIYIIILGCGAGLLMTNTFSALSNGLVNRM